MSTAVSPNIAIGAPPSRVPVLPVSAWPSMARAAWQQATRAGRSRYDHGYGPAAGWSPETRTTLEAVYGLYAGWLGREGRCESWPTQHSLADFVHFLERERRHAPSTIAKHVDGLYRLMRVLAPGEDWGWLRLAANARQRIARNSPKPVANRTRIVALDLLERLGREVVNEARASPRRGIYAAVRFRDGVMIQVLARRAFRRKNLMQIRRGHELVLAEDGTWIRFTAAQMKGRRSLQVQLAPLRPLLDEYIAEWLPILGSTSPGDPFWPSRFGGPLHPKAASKRVGDLTQTRLGVRVTMHPFRHALATTVAERLPGGAQIATPILAHAHAGTTEQYYAAFAESLAAQAEAEALLAQHDDPDDLARALTGKL